MLSCPGMGYMNAWMASLPSPSVCQCLAPTCSLSTPKTTLRRRQRTSSLRCVSTRCSMRHWTALSLTPTHPAPAPCGGRGRRSTSTVSPPPSSHPASSLRAARPSCRSSSGVPYSSWPSSSTTRSVTQT